MNHFRSEPDGFELIVADFTVSHMSGLDPARKTMRMRPDIQSSRVLAIANGLARSRSGKSELRTLP